MREASGIMRWGAMRGVPWATEARTPAAVRRITVGRRKRALAITTGPARARTSSPRSIRQPAGSSMTPTRAERRVSARPGMTNISATRIAPRDANSGASREKATSPRSIASWSRFSVGSSVLSSGSTSPLMAYTRLRRRPKGIASELTRVCRPRGRQARFHCCSPFQARCRRWPCEPWRLLAGGGSAGIELAFDEAAAARGH